MHQRFPVLVLKQQAACSRNHLTHTTFVIFLAARGQVINTVVAVSLVLAVGDQTPTILEEREPADAAVRIVLVDAAVVLLGPADNGGGLINFAHREELLAGRPR